ncbi:MAG: hypothetical protein ACFFF9_09420 [Candidatus Thorarchaeota archaeon]
MVVEDSKLTDGINDQQIQVQLIIGIVAVPLLIMQSIFFALASSYSPGWNEYRALFELFYTLSRVMGISGGAFLVVGTIAILKRNGSNLAWILIAVYIFGWIWSYAFIYAIFPGVMGMEGIDGASVISTISNIRTYSEIAILLYAWWSIHDSVAYRFAYFSYLLTISSRGIISYVLTGLLFGFGGHQIWTPEEAFALFAPGLAVSIVGYVIIGLFLITQLIDHRRIKIV